MNRVDVDDEERLTTRYCRPREGKEERSAQNNEILFFSP